MLSNKKVINEELLSKVSGGTGMNNAVEEWYYKHANTIMHLYKSQHPEMNVEALHYWLVYCLGLIHNCGTIQEAKTIIKTTYYIDVDNLN